MKRLLSYLLLLCSISLFSQEISENDKNALIALYNSTNGANWTNTWNLDESPTNWYGVVTNIVFGSSGAERHVDEINLSNNNLTGTIPIDLGNLKSLNTLNLSDNTITGTIPGELGSAEDLNYLYLQNNQLNGDIPIELFTLNERHFVEINLSSNKLTGTLPVEIGNSIANIGHVNVSNNLLTDVPNYTNISLFRIETLDISNNNIYFSVFERTPSFDNIAEVLEDNVANLTYSPQNKIGDIENITIDEGNNTTLSITSLTSPNNTYQWLKNGQLIENATNATYEITNADLTNEGTYHCEIKNSNVSNLTVLRNDIFINVNAAVTDRNALIAIYNATDGANWTNPWDLTANESTWTGVTVNNDGRVTELSLSFRNLNGTLPNEIGNLTELTKLNIFGGSSNNLTGTIPASICNLTKLESITLSQNKLTGEIPSCLFSITSLKTISISGDSPIFILDLPNDLSHLVNLESLSLQRVDLSSEGGFPESVFQLTNLTRLYLDINRFTGEIPPGISNLTELTYLNIGGNNLTGSIPSEIGSLTNLIHLSFRNTSMSGNIPSELGNLTNLIFLTIGGTDIEGEIPSSFSNLAQLKIFSIGRNNLSGPIPNFFTTFNDLSLLEFHENNFSGAIPDFTGNSGLTRLFFDNNNFVFDDFENEFSQYQTNISLFRHTPQSNIDSEETFIINEGETITLSVEATQSSNNNYQWRKNGVNIDGANERTLVIPNAGSSDIGEYDCLVTNSIVNDLTLIRNKITLNVTLGFDDFSRAGIKVYPIPAKDNITLSLGSQKGENITASIYSILGNLILEKKNVTNNQALDLSGLQSGSYILKLSTNTKDYTSNIIKL